MLLSQAAVCASPKFPRAFLWVRHTVIIKFYQMVNLYLKPNQQVNFLFGVMLAMASR